MSCKGFRSLSRGLGYNFEEDGFLSLYTYIKLIFLYILS